ncbi:glutathione synthetase, chloroplastic-like [Glycine soja]|uniref:Glutathione synthetase n=2 Tax=Glycine subgen. Soja TaxID=1462606 RepID=I1JRF8_SOYBN|nr:glutathione synthetase, chloroplastic [Glycine max]XP_028226611.1 glutathione synthetase, chloroplastic-like [Glycine soja]RZC22249.1 Glutathione synthetase, chloroplastic [Glycine soja]|eukprot:XP_003521719.2 glutathione synthetase, chloroplastic [Glycine max]
MKMGSRSGGLVCSTCSYTGIRTRRFYTNNNTFPSFSFTFPHQPQSFSFPKPLRLMSQPLTTNSADGDSSVAAPPILFDYHLIDQKLLQNIVYDALVWSTLNCLLVGDKSVQRSGTVPGVGLVHLPLSLLPGPFPENHWKQACELAPIFNELVDRVSLDGKFLQESLSRTKNADEFTSRLLDIHSKMLQINKKEDIRMGIVRSDYMIDEKTKSLLQIEMNTISTSFALIGCLMTGLHKSLLSQYGKFLGLDSNRVPANNAVDQSAEALAKAWSEYNNPRAAILVVVQVEERNMYEQHYISALLREKHHIRSIRKTLTEIDQEGEILPDGTLSVDGQEISVVYFRAGYTPKDYPSESEWRARLLMEQSSAIKCPTISYHLVGTKKIQQELAKPGVLERFVENKDHIAKLRACFAGLWSLEDSDIAKKAIENPELFVMKPQREGGGNNIYGDELRETLLKLQEAGSEEDAAYILMQRIFPATSPAILVRDGNWDMGHVISEAGVFGTYLRNKDKVIINNESGYMVRTKISSSYEGGVLPGFGVVDTVYLT